MSIVGGNSLEALSDQKSLFFHPSSNAPHSLAKLFSAQNSSSPFMKGRMGISAGKMIKRVLSRCWPPGAILLLQHRGDRVGNLPSVISQMVVADVIYLDQSDITGFKAVEYGLSPVLRVSQVAAILSEVIEPAGTNLPGRQTVCNRLMISPYVDDHVRLERFPLILRQRHLKPCLSLRREPDRPDGLRNPLVQDRNRVIPSLARGDGCDEHPIQQRFTQVNECCLLRQYDAADRK
jgi:hypothetical protein